MKNTTEIQLDTLITLITDLPKRIFEALDERERQIARRQVMERESLRLSLESLEAERKKHDMDNERG
jgi:hypothetical protein